MIILITTITSPNQTARLFYEAEENPTRGNAAGFIDVVVKNILNKTII